MISLQSQEKTEKNVMMEAIRWRERERENEREKKIRERSKERESELRQQ